MSRSLQLSRIALTLLVAATAALAQGRYAPVAEKDVKGLKFAHYYGPDKKYRDKDFDWTFSQGEFAIRKGQGAIPADLLEKLLPAGATADEIRGKWKLDAADGGQLVLTEIVAGTAKGKAEVKLPIYRTAPTVVRIGQPQYVFGVGK